MMGKEKNNAKLTPLTLRAGLGEPRKAGLSSPCVI